MTDSDLFDSILVLLNNKDMVRPNSSAGIKGVSFGVDASGHKKALVVDFSVHKKALQEFLEDLYGHEKIKERKGEPSLSKAEFLKGLKDVVGKRNYALAKAP